MAAVLVVLLPLRDLMPQAEGRANPFVWWAFEDDGVELELIAGPCRTRRALERALLRRRSAETV